MTTPHSVPDTANSLPVPQVPDTAWAGTDTATPAMPAAADSDMTGFFAIGAIIDVLLVIAFIVWALRQWRKSG